ncbi:MAG: inositol oxygenase family protein [Chloroflexota bacterium]|nr:MAG: inositol oxygenase [Chloroflexota bacterium]
MTDVLTGATLRAPREGFRKYEEAPKRVRDFYRLNHENQTLDFVLDAKSRYTAPENRRIEKTMWDMVQHLNALVDDSDPDTSFTQIEHAMQTAGRIRADGHPDWMVATGFIHDAGKALAMDHGLPQWAVVGDTFPVGCAFSDSIVYPELFAGNPDSGHSVYSTTNGVYQEHCGLDNVHLSFGHDEYLYHVVKDDSLLPKSALSMIRYHSFYAWHREGAYTHLTNAYDEEMLPWVQLFNPYDLYSKSDERPDVRALEPFYRELVERFFPSTLLW